MEVHSPVGFDEKLPLRCLLEVEKDLGDVKRFIAYVPEPSDPKAERALSNLKDLIVNYGKEFEVIYLSADPGDLFQNVSKVSAMLSRSLRLEDVAVCLNAGMRHVLVAMVLAVMTVDTKDWGRVFVYLGSEGDPTKRALLNLASVIEGLRPLCEKGDLERAIYAVVSKGPMKKADILKKLREMGYDRSKQRVYEVINRMVEAGSLEVIKRDGKELVALKGYKERE
ncbi:hypothetical protein [Ignicoccus hospitalis]|uniref:Csa3 N-terminal domain-containing protein n=1 Tax=Ignicoccus hospitalis (strain KIN4/I / DSM 18386 / JCM 14125) TaxID=453591 RepID=A8ABI9_IGNH4|nr:hypothetical protein [Ignicoccus hospitalis]ABU82291.1 hypothetical protein Igni_1114 [Ignicoccus hospitalis KIN4/I]HIH90789.1 hypothetical protein [Desulfurococcaceae archaeon]